MSLAQRIFGAGEPEGPNPADVSVDLPLEIVYELLSTWRRRELLRQLHDRDQGDGVKLTDLSRAVARKEFGKSPEELSDKEYKRVQTGFYQTHVPKINEAGLVDYDSGEGRVYSTEQTAEVIRFHAVDRSMIAEGRANE